MKHDRKFASFRKHPTHLHKMKHFLILTRFNADKDVIGLIHIYLFVYQCQKVHLFRSSLSFLTEAQPRLERR
jgi:hypothetical protein